MSSSSSSSRTLVGPEGYVRARREAEAAASADGSTGGSGPRCCLVDGRPYLPLLEVDPSDEATVLEAARAVVSCRATTEGGRGGEGGGGRGPLGRQVSIGETWRRPSDVAAADRGRVSVITGGLTNALFRVDDLPPPGDNGEGGRAPPGSVLVRIFGADGLIDRDEETATFARLCGTTGETKVVHDRLDLLGRFGNGRVEAWIPGMRPAHHARDFGREGLAREVARQMARLHYGFDGAETEEGGRERRRQQPALWTVTRSWIEDLSRLLSSQTFGKDPSLLELFSLAATGEAAPDASPTAAVTRIRGRLLDDLDRLRRGVEARHPDAPIVFCHNDVNAANVLLHDGIDLADADDERAYDRDTVCLIDYEYGATNYAMYDAANFFCEHCGGNDDGAPDSALLPGRGRRAAFLGEYVRERDAILRGRKGEDDGAATAEEATSREIAELGAQVELFLAASDLYWGTWGLLQAAGEVADGTFRREGAAARMDGAEDAKEWDNLRYGRNRLDRFRAATGHGQDKD